MDINGDGCSVCVQPDSRGGLLMNWGTKGFFDYSDDGMQLERKIGFDGGVREGWETRLRGLEIQVWGSWEGWNSRRDVVLEWCYSISGLGRQICGMMGSMVEIGSLKRFRRLLGRIRGRTMITGLGEMDVPGRLGGRSLEGFLTDWMEELDDRIKKQIRNLLEG